MTPPNSLGRGRRAAKDGKTGDRASGQTVLFEDMKYRGIAAYPSWPAPPWRRLAQTAHYRREFRRRPTARVAWGKAILCPPPLDQSPAISHHIAPRCSFHSKHSRECRILRTHRFRGSFVAFQYVLGPAVSLNCVPPTATVKGVEARRLTDAPSPEACTVFGLAHPSGPLSPEATT